MQLRNRRAALPLQLGVVAVFFTFTYFLTSPETSTIGRRTLFDTNNHSNIDPPFGSIAPSAGSITPADWCKVKMQAKYGDNCAKPYCEDLVGGFINYFKMHTCDLENAPGLSYFILIGWLLVQFWLLADTADAFFVPILQQIVVLFEVQPALAGITFLSFGNGAPDVFATIASFSQGGNAADIGIGSLLGSGMFVTTVVLALVAFQSDGTLKRRPFLRDIVCYLSTLSWLMYILYSKQCTLFQACIFVFLYIAFVVFVITSRKVYLKYYKVSGTTLLDEALLDDDDLQGRADLEALQQPEMKEDEDGSLWQWDGGLRLKLRAMKRATVAGDRTKRANMAPGRQRGFQSLTAAEYRKQLGNETIGNQKRIRAISHGHHSELDTSTELDFLHTVTDSISGTLDHAGGWADAAHKVEHHAHAPIDPESCPLTDGQTEPSVVEVLQQMLKDMIENFNEENWFGKFTYPIHAPLTFLRRLSIPVLGNNFFDEDEDDDDKKNVNNAEEEEEEEDEDGFAWSKPMACVSCICLPLIGGLGCVPNALLTTPFGHLPVWVLLTLIGLIVSIVLGSTTAHNHPPRRRLTAMIFLIFGFVASILWIYFIANELVTILQILGILTGIPNSVLGLTVLAWANSAPDTISIVGVAKQGYVQMAIGGVYAGRMFDTLCGLGLGLTVGTLKAAGPIVLHPDNVETISFATLLVSVVSAGIIVPLSGFKYTKQYGVALLILYFLFLLLGILAAVEVIKW